MIVEVMTCSTSGGNRNKGTDIGTAFRKAILASGAEAIEAPEALAGRFAFHAGRADACYADGERAAPQPGGYYGGWVTRAVVGPFKGEPGTERW